MRLQIIINIIKYLIIGRSKMADKCKICGEKIEVTFLGKIKGTYIKKKAVCQDCQKKYSTEEILKKI